MLLVKVKINKRGGSNKSMEDGFFGKNNNSGSTNIRYHRVLKSYFFQVGYPFVLPDMIGGNGYADDPLDQSQIPSKEMFIRWLQANIFMPAIQFSFVPWL